MTSPPRYVRFAQCLALVSGLGACATSGATSTSTSTSTSSTTTGASHTSVASTGSTNASTTLAQCDCACGSATHEQPSCYDVGMSECCVVEGPLPPPDLAV
jgi:hypothetical protein